MENKCATKCAVVVNTCDKYETAWYPFFELVKIHWSGCPYRFYLNTEKKPYRHDGIDLEVLNCLDPETACKLSWGTRFRDCLARIDAEYVILLLEDFFLQEPVDMEELNACLQMMEENPKLTAIYFKQIYGFTESFPDNEKYFAMNENKEYRLNLQAGLWRKDALMDLVLDTDSPWSFESGQGRLEGKQCQFLCSKKGTHSATQGCVFPYLTERRSGFGIWKGKWLWNNTKMLKSFGICIPEVQMEQFSRFDMFKYYLKRIREKLLKP